MRQAISYNGDNKLMADVKPPERDKRLESFGLTMDWLVGLTNGTSVSMENFSKKIREPKTNQESKAQMPRH